MGADIIGTNNHVESSVTIAKTIEMINESQKPKQKSHAIAFDIRLKNLLLNLNPIASVISLISSLYPVFIDVNMIKVTINVI